MNGELEPDALTGTVRPPREAWTVAKKNEIIGYIIDTQSANQNDEESGEKHLANPYYALEAIEAVLADNRDNGALRQFLEAPARAESDHELEEWQ